MKDTLITFETAKWAIEKGYPKFSSICSYNNKGELIQDAGAIHELPATEQSLLQKWLREKHQIHIFVDYVFETNSYFSYSFIDGETKLDMELERLVGDMKRHSTYENALESALLEALNRIK